MDILPQIIIFSLIASSVYMLVAAGLTLTFGTLGFINFAHGDMAMIGAFAFFIAFITLKLPLFLSLILSVLAIGLVSLIIEKITFEPVSRKQAFIPLLLSIGVSIILQSLVTMYFGGGSQTYQAYQITAPIDFSFWNDRIIITLPQIALILTSVVVTTCLFLFLKYTRSGKTIRAVSDNREVSSILGINVKRTFMVTFVIASMLAALGGILVGFDQNISPRMGLLLNIKVFAAIIIGGVGNLFGAVVGSLIIGFLENFVVGFTGIPGSFKDSIVFLILIVVLILRPYGLFGGKKEEVESQN